MAESIETYQQTLAYIRKRGALIGMDIFSPAFQPFNNFLLFVLFDVVTFSMVTVYCVFEFIHDLEKLVFCLVTYGFAIQVRSEETS